MREVRPVGSQQAPEVHSDIYNKKIQVESARGRSTEKNTT